MFYRVLGLWRPRISSWRCQKTYAFWKVLALREEKIVKQCIGIIFQHKSSNISPTQAQDSQHIPNMASKMAQHRANIGQHGANIRQHRPNLGQHRLNIGQHRPNIGSTWAQPRAQYAPDSLTCTRPTPTQTLVGRRPAVRRKPLNKVLVFEVLRFELGF